ncbi:MAG: hypothetical protein GXX96_20200 [Planctomycetaceae bacterium]|nr:hypothetical protein [Planctomycetaceae bacterium]
MWKSDGEWRTGRFFFVFVVAGSLLLSHGRAATASGNSSGNARQDRTIPLEGTDEAWIVSTRCVPFSCPTGIGPERFSYQVSRGVCAGWEQADSEAFFAGAAADRPVIVFVHGNRAGFCDAVNDGWPVYQRLRCESGGRPFQFVIWSWPADQIRGGPRNDALVKAGRSDVQSFYLAAWLDHLPLQTPVTLIGYSFGARIIGGALHLAQGGTLLGRTSPGQDRRPVRVMLVAAALDCEWLSPGSRNGQALGAVEQMFITRNCCDPVLRLYPRMRRCDSSNALGFASPASSTRLAQSGPVLETVGVESQVGRDHSWHSYFRSYAVRSRLAQYAFLAEGQPVAE